MFQGQFDLKDQGQGHQFSNSSKTIMSIHSSSLKLKFKIIQKLLRSQGITQMKTTLSTVEPKTILLPLVGGGGRHNEAYRSNAHL